MQPIKLVKYVFFLFLTSNLASYGMAEDRENAGPGIPRGPHVPGLPPIAGGSQIDQAMAQLVKKITQELRQKEEAQEKEREQLEGSAKRRRIEKEEESEQQPRSSTTTATTTYTWPLSESLQGSSWAQADPDWKGLPAVTMPMQQRRESSQASVVDQRRAAEERFSEVLPNIENKLFHRGSNLVNTIAQHFFEREITLDELNAGIARSPYTVRLKVIPKYNQNITPEQIRLIGQRFPHIRELSLAEVGLTNGGLTVLSQQQIAQNLVRLDVSGSKIEADNLSSINNFTNLKCLDVSHNSVSNKWLEVIAKAPFAANLVQLNVAANGITSSGVEAAINSFRSLRMLNVLANDIQDEGFAAIARAPFARNLTWLNVEDNGITTQGVRLPIQLFANLRSLSIARNSIKDAGFEAIAKAPCGVNLIWLNVTANDITTKGVRAAINLFTNLRTFSITNNAIQDPGFEAIAKAPCAANLIELFITKAGITTAGLQTNIAAFKNLRSLDIRNNTIGNAGLEALANGPCAPNLIRLFVAGTGITAAGLQTSIATFVSLRNLDVGNNNIGNAGLEALAKAPCARNLLKLNISNTAITAEGVKANIGVFTSLISLVIMHNHLMTDAGLEAIADQPFAYRLILHASHLKKATNDCFERIRSKIKKITK